MIGSRQADLRRVFKGTFLRGRRALWEQAGESERAEIGKNNTYVSKGREEDN